MIFFQKVVIENFQSHVHTECTFHPGLNVFVGPSDSGKSAILRALRWVLFNTPRGTDFIRAGANQCKVELHLSDGTIISRIRNHASINRYQLKKPGEEELILEGFGSEVPLEIANAHQIRPLQLEQKDILLQVGHQLEGPFLLSESSGIKAKTIGLVSGAHLIDVALKKLNSDRNQLATRSKYINQQQQMIEQKLLPYENLTSLEKSLSLAEKIAIQVKEKQALLIQLKQLSFKYHENKQEQKVQRAVLAKYPHLYKVEKRRAELEYKLLVLRQFQQFQARYHLITKEKKQFQAVYLHTESVKIAESKTVYQENKLKLSKQLKLLDERLQLLSTEKVINAKIYEQTEQIDEVAEKCNSLVGKKQQLVHLLKVQQQWDRLKVSKKKQVQILGKSSSLAHVINEFLPNVEAKLSRLLALSKLSHELNEKQARITKGHEWITDTAEKLHHFLKQYGELLKKRGKCPTCGSEINDNLVQHLLHEIEGGSNYAAAGREDQTD